MFINRDRVQNRIWIRLDGNVGWRIPLHAYDLIFLLDGTGTRPSGSGTGDRLVTGLGGAAGPYLIR